MAERNSNGFLRYLASVLDALRSTDPTPMRPAEVVAWIRSRSDVPPEDLTRIIVNGKQTIFENQVHWARFYLVKAGLLGSPKRGLWSLATEGRNRHLAPEDIWPLYVQVRKTDRAAGNGNEDVQPAPDSAIDDEVVAYWFAGALWNKVEDQLPRFFREGIWQDGDDKLADLVRKLKAGDRIAIKASFVQKHRLPFDVGGKPVSGMRIKAVGTVTENLNDGRTVKVAWDPPTAPRD